LAVHWWYEVSGATGRINPDTMRVRPLTSTKAFWVWKVTTGRAEIVETAYTRFDKLADALPPG